ncbi:hypothetical protein L2E82_32113 [Cichorium intybus]|uniref:Uncharacterized protein n=1 Tax=Cichorium intybus TaxID=13427 RepID=A0ACB9BF32_CICIN|nr:hypothetical protein L2E82_32113 [Cichorium intybus]
MKEVVRGVSVLAETEALEIARNVIVTSAGWTLDEEMQDWSVLTLQRSNLEHTGSKITRAKCFYHLRMSVLVQQMVSLPTPFHITGLPVKDNAKVVKHEDELIYEKVGFGQIFDLQGSNQIWL